MTAKTSICAKYKHVAGWHIFQSDDLPGMYVASKDAERAYNDITTSIELLMKLDEGIEVKVVPELSFREFIAAVRHTHDEDEDDMSPIVLSDKRFFMTGAIA